MDIFRHWRSRLPGISRVLEEHHEPLLEALGNVKPTVPPTRYISSIQSASGLEPDDVEQALGLLVDLYTLMDLGRLGPDTFLAEAEDELESLASEMEGIKAATILAFLDSALRLHETLGVAAKAGHLWLENERVYCSSRVLTDLRPIFDPPNAEQPQAFLAMHELKLTYHPSGDFGEAVDFRVQLDSRHLRKLRSEINRALDKEEALTGTVRGSGLEVLSTEEGE